MLMELHIFYKEKKVKVCSLIIITNVSLHMLFAWASHRRCKFLVISTINEQRAGDDICFVLKMITTWQSVWHIKYQKLDEILSGYLVHSFDYYITFSENDASTIDKYLP